MIMRIMCDTNVLVRAVISPYGAAADLLDIVVRQHLHVTSIAVLGELYDVLRRERIRAIHGLDDAKIRRVLSRLFKLSVFVPLPTEAQAVVPRDPKDNPIVVTAIAGQADVLCTLDRHLYDVAVVELCTAHGIRVMPDADLLTELRAE